MVSKRVPISVFMLSLAATAWAMSGSNGWDGSDGSDGSDGRSADVVADGRSMRLDLRGGDGRNGSDGSDGGDAHCFNDQKYDGGNGGEGGDGGDAGNGGQLIVRYADVKNLRSLYVDNSPGEKGRPGEGGDKGRGCGGGSDGRDGNDGDRGRDGEYGDIYLIPQVEALPKTNSAYRVPVTQLDTSFTLSRPVWEGRNGAQAFFAPGSQVQNYFRIYKGVVSQKVRIEWAANRPKSDFPKSEIYADFNGENVHFQSSGDIAVQGKSFTDGQTQVYRVLKVYKETDLTSLEVAGFTGGGGNIGLAIRDRASLSDEAKTGITLLLKTQGLLGMRQRYYARVPLEALVVKANQIEIDLARLGIDKRDLRSGKKAYAHLRITREFGDGYAVQELTYEAKLP